MINVVELSGTLSTDVKLADVGTDLIRAEFTLAVPSVRYDRRTNTDVVETAFIRVVAWEEPAAAAVRLHKGCSAHIRGELVQQEVETARGRKERKTSVRAVIITPLRITQPAPTTEDDYPTF